VETTHQFLRRMLLLLGAIALVPNATNINMTWTLTWESALVPPHVADTFLVGNDAGLRARGFMNKETSSAHIFTIVLGTWKSASPTYRWQRDTEWTPSQIHKVGNCKLLISRFRLTSSCLNKNFR
jgi:hypothetical protein